MAPGTTERLTRSPFLASVLLYTCFASALSSSAIAQADPTHVVSPATFPGTSWTHISSLKEAGWSQEKLGAARAYADADSIHTSAVMIVQGGKVVDQWGDIDKKITSYSVRKSLLSALYGIYSAEGVIDSNQTLEQLGIDDSPDPLTKEEKQSRIVDLLRARSGVYHPAYMETESMKKNRPARGSHAQGLSGTTTIGISMSLGPSLRRRQVRRLAKRFISALPSR